MEANGKLRALAAFLPGKNLASHWIGGRVGPRVIMDGFEKEGNKLHLPELLEATR